MSALRKLEELYRNDTRPRSGPRLAEPGVAVEVESPAQQLQSLLSATDFSRSPFTDEERWSARSRVAIMIGSSLMLWSTIFFVGTSILH